METLGQFLKREREFRGVSLETLTRETKINPPILDSLEADRWEELPRGVFLKGMLKSYCAVVGLRPDEVFAKYADILSATPKETTYQRFDLKEEKSSLIWVIVVTAIVIALAALVATR